jgi:hypothetical protein
MKEDRMGVSTNGILVYGIPFPEEYVFPWNDESDSEPEEWWLKHLGYTPPFEIYEDGEYINGVRPPDRMVDEYYNHRMDFLKKNPLPVSIEIHCSCDYPMYFVTLKHLVQTSHRGYPSIVNMGCLSVPDQDKKTIIDFCEKYLKPMNDYDEFPEMEPKLYLASLWC